MRVGVGWESMVVYLRFILKWICAYGEEERQTDWVIAVDDDAASASLI